MIGETLMEEPKTVGECCKVFDAFRIVVRVNSDYFFENAIQLVTLNNEIYKKSNP